MVVSMSHDDFPTLLAEALDALAAAEYDVVVAADWLGVSGSQLTRFVQRESAAWVHFSDARRQRGLRPLH